MIERGSRRGTTRDVLPEVAISTNGGVKGCEEPARENGVESSLPRCSVCPFPV